MQGKYKVITLCGSTRFRDEFYWMQKKLTMEGNIVISVGIFGHDGDADEFGIDYEASETKEMLDDMHKRKIDMADAICVINKDGYIGNSTQSEIKYAIEHGKEILWFDEDHIPPAYANAGQPEGDDEGDDNKKISFPSDVASSLCEVVKEALQAL